MPETYWYMGELWPCTGDQWQLKEKPPVCTTQSSYRSFVDKAWPFLNWLNISDKVGRWVGSVFFQTLEDIGWSVHKGYP